MATINYNRRFSVATAKRGDLVDITFQVSFLSPPAPSVNCWFDNVGDNLGGSQSATGPLVWDSVVSNGSQNLNPALVSYHTTGQPGAPGCFRFWCQGGVYPSPTTPANQVWKPINPLTNTTVTLTQRFRVHDNATIGTVIGVPTRVTPCSNTNYDANKLMIDMGSDCNLFIVSGEPATGYRTLTIVE
jgi:hypothetical protein